MVRSGLSSSGSGNIRIKPKDEMNDGAYITMKVDGEMTEVDITAMLIKSATVKRKGIVHLADDRERGRGKAVQASDSRLKPATTKDYGIVRLATSGERAPSVVVQGNDSRLNSMPVVNGGVIIINGDGKTRDFTQEHGMGSRPKTVVVNPLSRESMVKAIPTWDSKLIYFAFFETPKEDEEFGFSWIAIL